MKALIIAAGLMSLPHTTFAHPNTSQFLQIEGQHDTVERRSHHCDTAAQQRTARCRGV